jgi:hypothetical protein
MAYIPDKLGKRRRDEGVSQTAYECFVQYCEHADQETGITFATPKTLADALEMRSDNAKKYDDELQVKGWVELVIVDGKVCRKVCAGWKSLSERKGQKKSVKVEPLNFRNDLDELLRFRKNSYSLGDIPKIKEKLLNFRNTYKEYIDHCLNQLLDHCFDQIERGASAPAHPPVRSLSVDEVLELEETVLANESEFLQNEFIPASVQIYQDVFPNHPIDGEVLKDFTARLPEVEESVWRQTLLDWRLARYKASNIPGMISRYQKDLKDKELEQNALDTN